MRRSYIILFVGIGILLVDISVFFYDSIQQMIPIVSFGPDISPGESFETKFAANHEYSNPVLFFEHEPLTSMQVTLKDLNDNVILDEQSNTQHIVMKNATQHQFYMIKITNLGEIPTTLNLVYILNGNSIDQDYSLNIDQRPLDQILYGIMYGSFLVISVGIFLIIKKKLKRQKSKTT